MEKFMFFFLLIVVILHKSSAGNVTTDDDLLPPHKRIFVYIGGINKEVTKYDTRVNCKLWPCLI